MGGKDRSQIFVIGRYIALMLRDGKLLDASGSRHTTRPAHAGVDGHHTTVSPLFFIAYPQTQVPVPSVPGPCADTTAPVPQPILELL